MSSNSAAPLEGIRMENPESEGEKAGYFTEEPYGSATRQGKRGNPQASGRDFRPRQDSHEIPEIREEGWDENPADSGLLSTRDNGRAEFYKMYRDKAEEHDREYIDKYNEDMNNTLIFAGLFSAVTSAFITQLQPQLQPDSGDETAALLRILIYKFDNTTFGNTVPTLPQWTGPPHTIVRVQAILYASLAVSLLAAFLAMLGKQWLNRYASVGMRGSPIERSQSRQRKLDGTVTWRFDYVMESSPLMLQGALFLLGCALSVYLWEINKTIASVVLCITSLGATFYGFIVIAGAVFVNCPYQTPQAQVLRYIIRHIPPLLPRILKSAASPIANNSKSISVLARYWHELKRYSALNDLTHWLFIWFRGTCKSVPETVILDMQCISWVLRASMDKMVHLSALRLLATMTTLVDFNPTLISACFDILIGCVVAVDDKAVVTQESEELAAVSADCCLRTLSHTNLTLSTVKRVRKRYTKAFPLKTNFDALHPNHRLRAIHNIFYSLQPRVQRRDSEFVGILAHTLTGLANKHVLEATQNTREVVIRGRHHVKVPRWILRFALHYLSQDPLPPTSIIIDCLLIIAIDLDCGIPLKSTIQDESIRLEEILDLVTQTLLDMAASEDTYIIECKRKAVTAFFPYAVWRERVGDSRMMDAFLTAAKVFGSKTSLWYPIVPFIPTLFGAATSQTVVETSPYVPWDRVLDDPSVVAVWAEATAAVPDTEEVNRRVVDALLQIASMDFLRPHVPDDTWSWLNKRPTLPAECIGRSIGTKKHTVRRIRQLRDVETLKSYFLLVWSEWDPIGSPKLNPTASSKCLSEMQFAISRDLRGPEMLEDRKQLVDHLDYVLGQLERGAGYLKRSKPRIDEDDVQRAKAQYKKLRETLEGLDEGAEVEIPT